MTETGVNPTASLRRLVPRIFSKAQPSGAVDTLAFRLGLGLALMPTLIVLGFYLPPRIGFVRDATAGARFVVMICGDVMTMPGLPKIPSAEKIDLDDEGRVVGLF